MSTAVGPYGTREILFKTSDDLKSPSRCTEPPHMRQLAQISDLRLRHAAPMTPTPKKLQESHGKLSLLEKDKSDCIVSPAPLAVPPPILKSNSIHIEPSTPEVFPTSLPAPPKETEAVSKPPMPSSPAWLKAPLVSTLEPHTRFQDLAKMEHEEWKDNQARIGTLILENDNLIEQNRHAGHEVDALRDHVAQYSRTLNNQVVELDDSKDKIRLLSEVITQLKATKTALDNEIKQGNDEAAHSLADIEALQTEIRQKTRKTDSLEAKVSELQKAVSSITERYQTLIKESSMQTALEKELLDEIKVKSEKLQECHAKLSISEKKSAEMKEDADSMDKIQKSLERKIEELERAELISIEKNQQCIYQMEEIKFERDKALEREAYAQTQIVELTKKLDELPAKYMENNESEIQLLRSQFNASRRKFADETSKLETLCATLQAQSERAIREKRAAESELDKMTRHIPAESDRLTMLIEEMHSKLRASERERIEALHKVESIHQKMSREINNNEAERSHISLRADEAYRRLRKVERELEEAKEHHIVLVDKIFTLENEHKVFLESRTKKQVQHDTDMAALVQKHEMLRSDLEGKLKHATEAHSKVCREMQQLLNDQRRLGDKWKDESVRITENYEKSLTHLRGQMAQYQSKISNLETQLHKAAARHQDQQGQIAHEKREHNVLYLRCTNAESRIESLGRQVGVLVGKEAELIEDRRRLQRDLDRANIERDRMQQNSRHNSKKETKLNNTIIWAAADVAESAMRSFEGAAGESGEQGTANRIMMEQVLDLEADIARVNQRSMTGQHTHQGHVPARDIICSESGKLAV
ncbi:hypothetical protein BASA81_005264 [Batrachochytrium salamandrivorans]|nr:hypothetical protein BASA81_005264 [Batrachochytrium salamandrivorans]